MALGTTDQTHQEKLIEARSVLKKLSGVLGIQSQPTAAEKDEPPAIILPDGEELLFRVRLPERIVLDTPVLARFQDKRIFIYLADFLDATQFPIEINVNNGVAAGWYIRESKRFTMNLNQNVVLSDQGEFSFDDQTVKVEDGEIMVALDALEQWFDMELRAEPQTLELYLDVDPPLPIQQKIARQNQKIVDNAIREPTLPRQDNSHGLINVPTVDVFSRTGYSKSGTTGEKEGNATAIVNTSGDFLYGKLNTQSQLVDERGLNNLRMSYEREELDPVLLGPLGAKRYEVGDVTPVILQLDEDRGTNLGFRVTNSDPLQNYFRPSTEIRGVSVPGWDVELYRENQLIGLQTVGPDGLYVFGDVQLFRSINLFRVVEYGLQGEVREEEIYIPVDEQLLSDNKSSYDVMVGFQDEQTYRAVEGTNPDRGALNALALYETALNDSNFIGLGFETEQEDGERETTGHIQLSSILGGALLNFNTAATLDGEAAAELVLRRDFGGVGETQLRNETQVRTPEFGRSRNSGNGQVFVNSFSVNGPTPFDFGINPRYNFNSNLSLSEDGENALFTTAGFNTRFKRNLIFNQFINHTTGSNIDEDTIDGSTTVRQTFGRNRTQLTAVYDIQPDVELDQVTARLQRRLDPKKELDLQFTHRLDPELTEGRAQMNIKAGFADITPSLSYNSNNDLNASINTSFSIARTPQNGQINFYERRVSSGAFASVLVFLDKDGDRIFNGEDEPLEGVVVRAPQNGGREITGKNGIAQIVGMRNLRPTDIFIDPESLDDPFWMPGSEGVSIIPREGHPAEVNIPVHLGGEIDGTVYAVLPGNVKSGRRSIIVGLYDENRRRVITSLSESDGFYLVSPIAPGRYYLKVDNRKALEDFERPAPQMIEIGYDGTIIYNNEINLTYGSYDVPINFIQSADAVAIPDMLREKRSVFLNLGEHRSRFLMGVNWFKITRKAGLSNFANQIVAKPSEAGIDRETGKHAIRIDPQTDDWDAARALCRRFIDQGVPCSIDILPPRDGRIALASQKSGKL